MNGNLNHEEVELLQGLMQEAGIYDSIIPNEADPLLDTLVEKGYVTRTPLGLEAGLDEFVVSEKAASEYPSYLTNGNFGRYSNDYSDGVEFAGGEYLDGDGLKALEESFAKTPTFRFIPNPSEGQAFHEPFLAASERSLDASLEPKWLPFVHAAIQSIRASKGSGDWYYLEDCLGDLSDDLEHAKEGKKMGVADALTRLELTRHLHERSRIPQDVVLYMHESWRTADLPQRMSTLAVNAAYFGAAVNKMGHAVAQKSIPELNGGLSAWDHTLAFERANPKDRELDIQRWKFHNLHAVLGAPNTGAYDSNNPFRVSSIDSRPQSAEVIRSPRFALHFPSDIAECVERHFDARVNAISNSPFDSLVEWTDQEKGILAKALDQSFGKLPPEEQDVVRQWHQNFEQDASIWNRSWTPPSPMSQAAQSSFRRQTISLPPPSAAYMSMTPFQRTQTHQR
ncbi:hypothetical protein ACFV2D_37610 [Streptomyces capillispiralis]|uniref:hypothetical protein n=1 Tax=Streptomyces capillispiralis TaxID=68182 RepID=UPI00369E349F